MLGPGRSHVNRSATCYYWENWLTACVRFKYTIFSSPSHHGWRCGITRRIAIASPGSHPDPSALFMKDKQAFVALSLWDLGDCLLSQHIPTLADRYGRDMLKLWRWGIYLGKEAKEIRKTAQAWFWDNCSICKSDGEWEVSETRIGRDQPLGENCTF